MSKVFVIAQGGGPTAVIKSVAKMDHIRTGGTLLNQKFTPQLLAGDQLRRLRPRIELGDDLERHAEVARDADQVVAAAHRIDPTVRGVGTGLEERIPVRGRPRHTP